MSKPFISHVQTTDGLRCVKQSLHVTLKTENRSFNKVQIRHEPDNEEYLVDMKPVGTEGRLLVWHGEFPLNQDRDITHYVFKLLANGTQYWLDARGVQTRMPSKEYHFKFNATHRPPEWVSQQVFYQIFPDRFNNGNPDISVKSGEYKIRNQTVSTVAKAWGEGVGDYRKTASVEFYGGDLKGISDKLDYLQDLGVTALYLNPIFKSNSNHKYDTMDFKLVDPHLGTNQDLANLSQALHQRGMKIILDAVFNHTSEEHPWFDKNDLTHQGAYHHVESPYRDFYFFTDNTNKYIGWKGIETLPVLNFSHEPVRDYIYQSDDAVIRYWLRAPYKIDGWRFDVIHMLGEGEGAKNNAFYVQQFRQVTKQENPEAYVLGEHFFEATQWLQGDQEDGAMNYYGFAHPLRALLANQDITYDPIQLSPIEYLEWVLEASAKIPWLNQLSQLNQLDSHDTKRFITTLNGDEDKMRMALVMLFTSVGTPCLYYGTEVGLEGGHDPDNRRCFPWDKVETSDWWSFTKRLAQARKENKEWQSGSFEVLACSDTQIVFARRLEGGLSVMAFSFAQSEIDIPMWKLGIESGQGKRYFVEQLVEVTAGHCTLPLGAWQCEIIKFS